MTTLHPLHGPHPLDTYRPLDTGFTIEPLGAFSLRESALFGFGGRDADWDGRMRMAFCLDGLPGHDAQVGVVLTQPGGPDTPVLGEVVGTTDPGRLALAQGQTARILSLHLDGRGFDEVVAREEVLADLARLRPGLRPPQFFSPYEAALWAVLSARRPAAQMKLVRGRLAAAHGRELVFDGRSFAAVPTPQQMLEVEVFPGIPQVKLARMHAVAGAALGGQLDVDRLVSMGPDAALADLQRLPGIGPFYAALVVIRALGLPDVLPTQEPRAVDLVRRIWRLPQVPTAGELEAMAAPWAPYRTWAVVYVRAVGEELLRERAHTA